MREEHLIACWGGRRWRRIRRHVAGIAVALTTLGGPALAQASDIPLWVEANGTQTTTWSYPYFEGGGDCYGVPWSESSGSEVIHFQTRKMKVLAVVFGKAVILHYGNWSFDEPSKVGLIGKGYIDREATASQGTKPGPCGGQTSTTKSAFDCHRQPMRYDVDAGWMKAADFQLLILADDNLSGGLYNTCPVTYPNRDRATGKEVNITPGQFTTLDTKFPKKELLDRHIGKEIVLAHAHYSDWNDPGQRPFGASTTVRWTITFTKAR